MGSYKQFLFWALAHLQVLQTLASQVQAVIAGETLAEKWNAVKGIGDTLLPALNDLPVGAFAEQDEAAMESAICASINEQPRAAGIDFSKWDGHRLAAIWKVVGPLIPVLLALIPK